MAALIRHPAPGFRRRRHPVRRLTALVLTLALATGAAALGGLGWFDAALQRTAVFADGPHRPPAGPGSNWLLVGSDSRAGLSPARRAELTAGGDADTGRTDTVLLVHLPGPRSTTPATVVSIPRDSYLPIPGHGVDKLNAAYPLGGPALLAETVEGATGLRLDHYAEIGFAGFADLVDAVGGVRVCLPEPVVDPLAGLDLPAGCDSLDGPAALGYVRSRATPRADLDRMDHQRAVLAALLRRLTEPAVWADPARWLRVPRAAAAALTVADGDHVWDLLALGRALRDAGAGRTVPVGGFADTAAGDVVVWDRAAAAELFAELGAAPTDPPQ